MNIHLKSIKNSSTILILVLLIAFTVVGCSSQKETLAPKVEPEVIESVVEEKVLEPDVKVTMRVGTLKGPTGMGMVDLMERDSKDEAALEYEFDIMGSPDELVGKIISGELDVAAVPTNMALLLNNKTEGAIQLAAVNTLGVLYVLENGNEIQSIADLKGKTVHTSGKGASPDFVFQYLLKQNGLNPQEDVTLEYKLEHADLASAMVEGDVKIGLLPQPHVTTALMKNPDLRIALDVTKEWSTAAGDDATLAMGVLIVQKAFVDAHPEAFHAFLDEYEASVAFVNKDVDAGAALIEKYGILPNAAIAKKAIPYSNIVFINALEAKPFLEQFFEVLYGFEPKSIGGKLADEGFYYQR